MVFRIFTKYPNKVIAMTETIDAEPEENFEAVLMPLCYRVGEDVQESADSLLRLILNYIPSQPQFLKWLVEKLVTFEDLDSRFPKLVLTNLKWLSSIKDSDGFAKSFMEVFGSCNAPIQHEMLLAIPEIIDDKGHKHTVEALQALMNEDSSFSSAILETFSSLNLEQSLLDSIREDLLKRLDSMSTEYLPNLIKFLLQTTPSKHLNVVINRIRNDVDLSGMPSHVASQSARNVHQKQDRATCYLAIIMDSIKTAMAFDERVATGFLNAISADKYNKALDVYVLFFAHSMSKMKNKVETIFKKKVMSRDFTKTLLNKAIKKNGNVLSSHFTSVLAIAERGVRSLEPLYVQFGSHLYQLAFAVFSADYDQQYIVGAVLEHVGSQNEDECSAGLDVLLQLAKDPRRLKPMWIMVETVLDHIADFSKENMRKAWNMFCALVLSYDTVSGKAVGFDENIYDSLQMILRKQVTNVRHSLKRSGIIGHVAMLAELGSESVLDVKKDVILEETNKLFNALLEAGLNEPAYMALAMDELSLVIQLKKITSRSLLDGICMRIQDMFEKNFILDPKSKEHVQFDLNKEESSVALKLWSHSSSKNRDCLVYLCPIFRALQSATKECKDNSLEDYGALAGLPLFLYPEGHLENFGELEEAEQIKVCVSMFYGINWMRESINAFCDQKNAIIRNKILQRLSHLHYLQHQFDKLLKQTSGAVVFLPDTRDPTESLGVSGAPSAAKKSKKTKDQGVEESAHDRLRNLDLEICTLFSYPSNVEENSFCLLRPFSVFLLFSLLNQSVEIMFETKKRAAAPQFRSAKKTKGEEALSLWKNRPKEAIQQIVIPILAALSDNLSRLGRSILSDEEDEEEENEKQLFDQGDPDVSEDRETALKNYMIPSQKMAMDIFRRLFVWLNDSAKNVSEDDAKSCDVLVKHLFAGICGKDTHTTTSSEGLTELKRSTWNFLVCTSASIKSFENAVSYAQLLEAVALYGVGRKFASLAAGTPLDEDVGNEAMLVYELSKQCANFLHQSWKSSVKSVDVKVLIEMFLCHSKNPTTDINSALVAMEEFTKTQVDEEHAVNDNSGALEFPTLTKSTLNVFYKTSFAALTGHLREMLKHIALGTDGPDERLKKLGKFIRMNKFFSRLVSICKSDVSIQIKSSALKEGKIYLEQIQRGIPFLSSMVDTNINDVVTCVKKFQEGTRTLQRLCGQIKVSGEKLLIPLVPATKKCLEKLVLEMRRIMESVGMAEAMTMGMLKPKDLDGNALSSQVSYKVDKGKEEDEEQEDDGEDEADKDAEVEEEEEEEVEEEQEEED